MQIAYFRNRLERRAATAFLIARGTTAFLTERALRATTWTMEVGDVLDWVTGDNDGDGSEDTCGSIGPLLAVCGVDEGLWR